jgi:hypothetical protein
VGTLSFNAVTDITTTNRWRQYSVCDLSLSNPFVLASTRSYQRSPVTANAINARLHLLGYPNPFCSGRSVTKSYAVSLALIRLGSIR